MIDGLWSELKEQIKKSYEPKNGVWITEEELKQLKKHPLHQARSERFNKEKKELEKYITKYQNKYQELKKNIDSKITSYQYGKGGGELHRGALCPSKIIDVVVGNIKRGRLLKKYKDNLNYIYGFDKENQLCRVEIIGLSPMVEYIVYENGIEVGLTYNEDGILKEVSKCRYKDSKIVSYQHAYSIEDEIFLRLDSEKYDYSNRDRVLISWEEITGDVYQYHQIEVFLDQEGYGKKYYFSDIIGGQLMGEIFEGKFDRKVNFFSEKENKEAKSNEENMQVRAKGCSNPNATAKDRTEKEVCMNKLCEQLYQDIKSTIESWEEPDIYAISFLVYNINEETQTPILELGYNTEEQYLDSLEEEEDTQEVRWNYAYWIQNQEYIFGYDETEEIVKAWLSEQSLNDTDDDELLAEEFMKQLIFVAQELHKNNVIKNHFKKDIPILIHGLEYYDKIAYQTELANPKGVADEFVSWIKAMY